MDEIVDLLQTLMQQASELAGEFTEEEQAQILKIFTDALQIIQQLQQRPIEAAGAPQITPGGYPSSNVNGFKYDPDKQELFVQFHGPYPKAAGPIYSYGGVPKYLFDIISKGAIGPKTSGQNRYHQWIKGVTPSLGGSVNAILKAGGFAYQKIS